MKALSLVAVFILSQFFWWGGLLFVLLVVFYFCQWYYREGKDFDKFEKNGGTTIITTITFTPSRDENKAAAHCHDRAIRARHSYDHFFESDN